MKPRTGTPVGWTFYNRALSCWQKWKLYYLDGLKPDTELSLDTGSAYHLLMEGESEASVAKVVSPAALEEGKRLHARRTEPGSPVMGAARHVEKTYILNDGYDGSLFSSRPDRVEKDGTIRELKTSNGRFKYESEQWHIHGEIIGELLATGAPRVIIDVVVKTDPPTVRLFEVKLDEVKRREFLITIRDLRDQIRERMKSGVFPRNNVNCIQYGRLCEFYNYCWGTALDRLRMKKEKPNLEWRRMLGVDVTSNTEKESHGNSESETKKRPRRSRKD